MMKVKFGHQKFRVVYERQMASDVPKPIEQFLLVADFMLRRGIADLVRLAAFAVLVWLIFAINEFLNGRIVPPMRDLIGPGVVLLAQAFIIQLAIRAMFSRSSWPLKHRIEMVV